MKLVQVKKLKDAILQAYMGDRVDSKLVPSGLQKDLNQLSRQKNSSISAGYSKMEDDFYLELRSYSTSNKVLKVVKEILELADGKVSFEVYSDVSIATAMVHEDLGEQCRPLCLGASVGHASGGAGSIGGFIEKDGERGIITCSHVLAPINSRPLQDDSIYQPGVGRKMAKGANVIAKLADWGVLTSARTNQTDSGIALLNDEVDIFQNGDIDGNYLPEIQNFKYSGRQIRRLSGDTLGEGDRLLINTEVHKVGFKTGYTTGRLRALSLDQVKVSKKPYYFFDNVIQIDWPSSKEPFSNGGDSGSLVFVEHENSNLYGLGIVFATGLSQEWGGEQKHVSFACDLNDALDNFNVEWLE